MSIIVLFTWLGAASAGLYLLAVWLIEYDRELEDAEAARLPVPVISTHALLAVGGLVLWVIYLFLRTAQLAWTAVTILLVVAVLGLIMTVRWLWRAGLKIPAERNFPLSAVIGHGLLAVTTLALVVLVALGRG